MANEPSGGFEVYHIPQQSRRDKLRFSTSLNSYEVDPTTTASTHHHHSNNAVTTAFHHHHHSLTAASGSIGYLPVYDPSALLPPDLLSNHGGFSLHHHQPSNTNNIHHLPNPDPHANSFVKEEGINYNFNFMGGGFGNNTRSISFIDPHGSLSAIPGIAAAQSSITTTNNNDVGRAGGVPSFFLCPPVQTKEIDHHNSTAVDNDLVLYKSQPMNRQQQQGGGGQGGLSLSLSSNSVSVNHQNPPTHFPARYPAPLGPFTGYASVLSGSKFLRPAQMLLQEICDLGIGGGRDGIPYGDNNSPRPDLSLLDPPNSVDEGLRILDEPGCSDDDQRDRRRKSRLISMLDEMVRRYKQYYHQFQAVIASFETVPGVSDAAPFANLALKAISKHFRCLRNAITDQLQFTSKSSSPAHSLGGSGSSRKLERNHHPHHRSTSNFNYQLAQAEAFSTRHPDKDNHLPPVWRPQRGLPERAVSVLRAWLFEHFLHPYPTDTDKMMLAKQTGLTRSQVSNWFINARVRLWKPMVEEIHALETKQQSQNQQNPSSSSHPPNNNNNNNNQRDHHLPSASSFTSDHNNPSNSGLIIKPPQQHDNNHNQNITPIKRVRNDQEILDFPFLGSHQQQMSMHYSNHNHQHHHHLNSLVGGSSSNVSLTLGLHHQNSTVAAVGLASDQFPPIGLAHTFGLGGDHSNEQCAVPVGLNGFEGQNHHHFNRDVIGGSGHHLLHDFVG